MNPSNEIQSIMDKINEKDPGLITEGNYFAEIEKIPTGSVELDYITGGGIPIGRMSRFYGGAGTGKSLVSLQVIANAQKMGMTCAIIDIEKQYSPKWAAKQGVDTEKLLVINTSVIEDAGEIIEALLPEVDLFVIDSCSMGVSRESQEDGLNGRKYYGGNSMPWKTQFVHLNNVMDKFRNVIIYLDHVTVNFGPMGVTTLTPPGGKMMEHASSTTLEFKRGKWLWKRDGVFSDTRDTSKKTVSGGTEPDAIEVKVQCVKTRMTSPLKTANLFLDFTEGKFDSTEEYYKTAKFYGIVTGTSWVKIDGDDKSYRPKEVRAMIAEDEELREKIYKTVMESL